ncbi:MAG TPA: hypothetical protein DDW90_05995 [Cyanobacteria bacterium UBA9971]|nr:hypothetical protein [Cyanobacteria bacterium UBA9971]
MKTRFLFVFLCIFLLFLADIKTVNASTSKVFESHVIPVQNKVDISEDYPIVDQIETKVLGQSYQKEDIYKRLGRIEIRVFGSVSQKTLSDRVDDLSKIIIGSNNNSDEDYNYSAPAFSSSFSSDNDSYSESYSSPSDDESLNNLLNQMEKKLLNQVFPNDTRETRVARLERYLFNNSSDEYSMNERLERLATVIKAQPSNEIVQDMNLLNNNKLAGNGIGLATIILMIVAGLLL